MQASPKAQAKGRAGPYPVASPRFRRAKAKAKTQAKAKAKAKAKANANINGGYTNVQNHRHKIVYMYPHESMTTRQIVATDVWESGDPSG